MQTTASYGPSIQPNILKAMQPQPAQNMYVQPAVPNSSSQVRSNQAGSLYRGPSASPAPRSGARHVPMQAMYPQTIHQGVQSVVVQPFAQYQRQAFQAPPYAQYTQPMQPNYPYPYPSYYPVAAQRGAVGVSTGVGVGSTMSVQPGPNGPMPGPPGATQTQLPLAPGTVLTASAVPPCSNPAVLGVAPNPSGQQVTVQSMVGVVPTTVSTQPSQKSTRLRTHALEIIDPITNKNILEDYDRTKTCSSSDTEYQEQNLYVQQPIVMADQLRNVPYDMMDIHQIGRDVSIGQTPVVSAITDGPSVEILPLMQKPRSKKILHIVNPKDGNSVQSAGNQQIDNSANRSSQSQHIQQQQHQHIQQSAKLEDEGVHTKNSGCVQQQLPVSQQSQQTYQPSQRVPPVNSKQVQVQGTPTTNIVITDDIDSNIFKDRTAGDGNQEQQQQQEYSKTTVLNPPNIVFESTITSDTVHTQNIVNNIGGPGGLNVAPITVSATEPVQIQHQLKQEVFSNEILEPAISGTFNKVNATEELAPELATNLASSQMPVTDLNAPNMQLTEVISPEGKENIELSDINKDADNGTSRPNKRNGAAITQDADSLSISATEIPNKNYINDDAVNHNDKNVSQRRQSLLNNTKGEQLQHLQISNSLSSETTAEEYDETDRAFHQKQTSNEIVATTSEQNCKSTFSSDSTAETVNPPTIPVTQVEDAYSDASCVQNDSRDNENNIDSKVDATIPSSADRGKPLEVEGDVNSGGNDQSASQESPICYNVGQWSPNNPTGKKQYDRDQLLQLRDTKASRRQPEVNNVSILPTPNLMPSFVLRNPKRVQSAVNSLSSNRGANGSISGAGGSGSYVNKPASISGVHGRGSVKGMININLSLNLDVKLNEADNAWRPRGQIKGEAESDPVAFDKREKEELIRRVRGILNKLTPEKFDSLVEEIIKLKIDTPDKMDDVMILVFEKAIDEPNFSVSYARLCYRLISEVKARDERMESGTKTNLTHFRAALLDKTEREFTQNVTKSTAKEIKLQPIIEKIAKCIDPTEKAELEAQLEEEERKIRRRSGGTVRFIGELFKISMLTGNIINSCIEALLNPNSEDQLECLCKLLTTVGEKFEQTPCNAKDPNSNCYSLEKTMTRMQAIASKSDKDGAKVSSRVRFMLQDVIDLRHDKWKSKRNEAPKTMGQVEKEMKSEQLSSQFFNYAASVAGGGGGSNGSSSSGKREERGVGGRYNDSRSSYGGSHSQRGETGSLRRQQGGGNNSNNSASGGHSNSNNDDSTWIVQTSKGSRCLDTNKLEGLSTANNFDTKKMGGLSQFIWSHGSRQSSTPTSTPSNPFAPLSALVDTSRSNDRDRDRDRDRSGPRNKGSFNKGSMERDRYGMHPRSGSSQASRESSSSRGPQQSRSTINTSAMQKSASHSKYTQQQMASSNRTTSKTPVSATGSSLYPQRGIDTYSRSNQQGDSCNSGKPTEPPAAVFEESTIADIRLIKSVVSEMVEIASYSKTLKNAIEPCILRVRESQRSGLLCYIMTDYLHFRQVGKLQRRYLGNIVVYLIDSNFMSREHFLLAYNKFCERASDLALDTPDIWKYIIEFTGPLVKKLHITIYDLWNKQLKDSNKPSFGKKFLKIFLDYSLSESGPSFTRTMWKKRNIKWTDFMEENEVKSFIQTNKFEYIENDKIQPTIVNHGSKADTISRVVESVEQLLKEEATADCIIDYINGNFVDIDKHFIRSLAPKLCDFAISYKDNSYKLEIDCFQKICIPVLQRYIDSKEEFELECLYSMQLLVTRLEHPRALLSDLFGELYDADVIPQDSFLKWRESKEHSAGKGVAVKGLNPFFNHVLSSETSDENN